MWNEGEARELEAQAATVDLAAASHIVRRTTERFDAYAYAWTESSIATCRAAHSGALTDDAHMRRLACLDEGLVAIGSLAHELSCAR